MKERKIILGVIAIVVTTGSNVAFKVATKFGTHHKLFVQASTGCSTCITIWTHLGSPARRNNCLTKFGNVRGGAGSQANIFYTHQNVSKSICTNAFSAITTVQ